MTCPLHVGKPAQLGAWAVSVGGPAHPREASVQWQVAVLGQGTEAGRKEAGRALVSQAQS